VAGVPARVIGCAGSERPSQTMDQHITAADGEP
jgi:serine acetyltransferase